MKATPPPPRSPTYLGSSVPTNQRSPRPPSKPHPAVTSVSRSCFPFGSVPTEESAVPVMARATGPDRRLLAIYTGGTIGMRSEGGGESVPPRPKQNNLRVRPLGTPRLSLARGDRTLPPLGALVAGSPGPRRGEGHGNSSRPEVSLKPWDTWSEEGPRKTALFCA